MAAKDHVVRRVAVLGGGAFGTAMANHLASKGTIVQLWAREEEVVESINSKHENSVYLAGGLRKWSSLYCFLQEFPSVRRLSRPTASRKLSHMPNRAST